MKTTQLADISKWFFETISDLQKTQETVTIGLPGGTSLDTWYAELLQSDWSKIRAEGLRFCLVDERCVESSDPDRNDAHVGQCLIEPLCAKNILTQEQFIRLGDDVDALEYGEQVGVIDIAIFGLGPDGHIASLFPHHPALEAEVDGYIRIHDAPKNPPERISLSPLTVSEIPHACLFAVGEQKKEALANFFDETKTFMDCPAKLLAPELVFDTTDA